MSSLHDSRDAITATRFALVADGGEQLGSFGELVDITSDAVAKKLPGKRKPPTLTLKRGKTQSLEMWSWHDSALSGDMLAGRKDCSLVMYGVDGKPVARYHLEQAWPSKLQIGAGPAGGGGGKTLTETVTLTCQRIQRVAP